jgi:hypothetical protein
MKKYFASTAFLIATLAGLLVAAPAQAVRIIMDPPPVITVPLDKVTYEFVGTCTDCILNPYVPYLGVAHLTLQGYKPGDAISLLNFFSFTYDGSPRLNPFTISAPVPSDVPGYDLVIGGTTISGTIPASLSQGFEFDVSDGYHFFTTHVGGTWVTGLNRNSFDEGVNGNWTLAGTAVPEPASIALLGFGMAAMGFLRRRRKTD